MNSVRIPESITPVVLVSGGLDSLASLVWTLNTYPNHRVHALTVDYGQTHVVEIESAKTICAKLGIPHRTIALPYTSLVNRNLGIRSEVAQWEDKTWSTSFVPFRNILLLTLGLGYSYSLSEGGAAVAFGGHRDDHFAFPDCRPAFLTHLEATFRISLGGSMEVHVLAPFVLVEKAGAIQYLASVDALDLAKYTHTCYRGKRDPKCDCESCVGRRLAFERAGVRDPLWEEVGNATTG